MKALLGENQGSMALVTCDMTVALNRERVCVCVCWADVKRGQNSEKSILRTSALLRPWNQSRSKKRIGVLSRYHTLFCQLFETGHDCCIIS